MAIQRIISKSAKTEALLANPATAVYVPETRPMSRESVRELLLRYGMIYVKPVRGTFGRGVARLEWTSEERGAGYRLMTGTRRMSFVSFDAMYDKLATVKRKGDYLAQQGIEMLNHGGRRFDLRVTVQRNLSSRWETTGMIGRVAHPRKIVTNYHSGGTPMPAETLLAEHLPPGVTFSDYARSLNALGEEIARSLEARFPRLQELGVDIAIGADLKPWILEVNTKPDLFLFRRLSDPAIYRRMREYAVAYGRYPRRRLGGRRKRKRRA